MNNNKGDDKKKTLSKILTCAALYKKDFSGLDFMLIYADGNEVGTLEASFHASNFMHLTGVDSHSGANEFFSRAVDQRLRETDFEVSEESMSNLKLNALPEFLRRPIASVNMLGEYDRSSKLKLNTGTLIGGVKSCMGFTKNDKEIFVPNTFLAEDIRRITIARKQVLAVWRKQHSNDRTYTEEWRVNLDKIKKMKLHRQYDSLKSNRLKQ